MAIDFSRSDSPAHSTQKQFVETHDSLSPSSIKNDSLWDKLSREAVVFGAGIGSGMSEGVRESCSDIKGTSARVAMAMGTGAVVSALNAQQGIGRLIGRGVSAGMLVSTVADVVAPSRLSAIHKVWTDTWNSGNHYERDKQWAKEQLGRFAFDAAFMSVAGFAGAEGPTLAKFAEQKFSNTGSNIGESLSHKMSMQDLFMPPDHAMAGGTADGAAFGGSMRGGDTVMLNSRFGKPRGNAGNVSAEWGSAQASGFRKRPAERAGSSDEQERYGQMRSLKSYFEESNRITNLLVPKDGLPPLSPSAHAILTDADPPLYEAHYGSKYSPERLATRNTYGDSAMRQIVSYDQLGAILDPSINRPQTFTDLKEWGRLTKAQRRIELGQSDPSAVQMRQDVIDRAAEGRRLEEQKRTIDQGLNTKLQSFSGLDYVDIERDLSTFRDIDSRLEGFKGDSKEAATLQLEVNRVNARLKRVADDGSAQSHQLRGHLEQQRDYLHSEIQTRRDRVGLVKDDSSPIARAQEELKENEHSLRYDYKVGVDDRPDDMWQDMLAENRFVQEVRDTQRALVQNERDQKEAQIKFSEAVYAYLHRMKQLEQAADTAIT